VFPEPYKRVLSTPGVIQPLLGVTVNRLAIAALPLSTVLLVRGSTGSFAVAGLVQACYSVAAAISLPIQGRLIDRIGQTPVILAAAAVDAGAYIALVLLAHAGAGAPPLAAIALVAGLATPPLGAAMRTLWSGLVEEEELRKTAFTLDAIAVDVAWIIGPGLIAVVIGIASPTAAVLVCAGISLAGSVIFAAAWASRRWHGGAREPHLAGPLRSPGIIVLMAAIFGVGIMVGAIELAITAFASDRGAAELAGVLIAVQAAGSVAGGLWFGTRNFKREPGALLPFVAIVFALSTIPVVAVPTLGAAFPLMVLSGLALAPLIASIYLLLDTLAPPGTAAEATGWILTAIIIGAAVGTGLAGVAVTEADPHAGLAVGLAGACMAAAAAWLGRAKLRAV
jgi:hypothetical protein